MVYDEKDAVDYSKLPIASDQYVCRVASFENKTSPKGYAMTVVKAEIVAPETCRVLDQIVPTAGRQFFFTFLWVPGETWGLVQAFSGMKKLGWMQPSIDPESEEFPEFLKNRYFRAVLETVPSYKTKNGKRPTKDTKPEEYVTDEAGAKVLDRMNIQLQRGQLDSIIGPCDEQGVPY